jgi:DNA polymerase-3 subunit epsilon
MSVKWRSYWRPFKNSIQMSKILFFDLETTGVDSKKNGIHQISGMFQIDGKIVNEFNIKFKPDENLVIEPEALAVSNLTVADLEVRELDEMGAYREFLSIIGKHCDKYNKKDKIYLCGYNNAAFDNQFLREFFLRQGDNYFGSWFWSNSLDVMVFASMLLSRKRAGMENFKLKTVAKAVGIEVDEAQLHDALYDVKLTKQIFDICIEKWYKKTILAVC